MQNKRITTKTVVILAMLAAIAYIVMLLSHLVPVFSFIPSAPFLKYDPKDVIIAIGGFIMGPMPALAVTIVVSLIEMVTISTTGIIGFIMNVLSTAAFACTASAIYKKNRTMKGAVVGLIAGVFAMTIVMLLWNYLIMPLYMHVDRAIIVKMLIPAFLPFNLIKAVLNAALTLLIYKPIVRGLRRANLLPQQAQGQQVKKKSITGVMLVAALLLVTCILLILALSGVI